MNLARAQTIVVRVGAAAALCLLLGACSVSNRGIDPRDSNAPFGTVGTNMGPSNAMGIVAGPMFFQWFQQTFMPDRHENVPPPPPPAVEPDPRRPLLEQDCTDPAKRPDKNLDCK